MSQKSLYDFETEQIDKMFDCKNYLFKNSKHEKVILESDTGVKMVRHIIYKPADVSVYQRLALINNPYLCRIYEISESTEAYTIYEEFCDGMTLTDYANGETLAEHDALNITCSICQGLYALHNSGIVHRDIKPDNIIICDDNNVKIIDFDISKIYKSNQRSDTQTLGTVGFAAPEQFGMQQSDARTDLYSLAVLLNVLLTGEHPSVKMFENKKILKVIKKCLSINPDDRYSTAEELYNVLNKIRRKLKYEKMS